MTRTRFPLPLLAIGLAACACVFAGCDRDDDPTQGSAPAPESTEALPAPSGTAGRSITGMPDAPGPGDVPLAGSSLPAAGDMVVEGVLPLEDNPETGLIMEGSIAPITPVDVAAGGDPLATPAPPMPVAPGIAPAGATGTADAVAVVSAYYAALAAGQHGRAYGLWSDGGRSSGQTPEQFARGFAGASGVVAQPGEARVLEGGGAPQVEVPVSVTTTLADGRLRRQVGAYVLRRSGSGAGASAWRIVSAELRELQP